MQAPSAFSECRPVTACLVAALAGLAYLSVLAGPDYYLGHGAFFTTGDPSQHAAGWLFFARDGWHFPWLRTVRLNAPQGVSIVFTDSVPLAALVFKPFAGLLPPRFIYLGLWQGLSFVLQAVAGAMLARSLGARSAAAALAAAAFALTFPGLAARQAHTALTSHFLILLSLAAYFSGRRGDLGEAKAARLLIALTLAAMLVHPYLMAMCAAVFAAFLADMAIAGSPCGRGKAVNQLARLGLLVLLIAVFGVVFGYFAPGSALDVGFGKYSTNLASFVRGGAFTGEAIDATGGQYEGACYFGLGGLAVLAFALIRARAGLPGLVRRYPALLAVGLLCFAYALSNAVYAGRHLLVSYPLPALLDPVTGAFRACGRFIWIPAYLALFAALAAALREHGKLALILVAAALALQWADLAPLRQAFSERAARPAPAPQGDWNRAFAGVDMVRIYPPFGCNSMEQETYLRYQWLAAVHGTLIDTGYIARAGGDCLDKERALEAEFTRDTLAVMPLRHLEFYPFQVPDGFIRAAARGECVQLGRAVVCRPGTSLEGWRALGFDAGPYPEFPLRSAFPGDKLSTRTGRPGKGFMDSGPGGKGGLFAFGPHTMLTPGRYRFSLAYQGMAKAGETLGRYECLADGHLSSSLTLARGELVGTDGELETASGEFEARSAFFFDVQAWSQGGAELRIKHIALEKLR